MLHGLARLHGVGGVDALVLAADGEHRRLVARAVSAEAGHAGEHEPDQVRGDRGVAGQNPAHGRGAHDAQVVPERVGVTAVLPAGRGGIGAVRQVGRTGGGAWGVRRGDASVGFLAAVPGARGAVGGGVLGADQTPMDLEVAVAVERHDHPGVAADRLGEPVAVGAGALDLRIPVLLAGEGIPQRAAPFGVNVDVVEFDARFLDAPFRLGERRGLLIGELGAALRIGDQVVLLVDPGELDLRSGPLPVVRVVGGDRVQLLLRELLHEFRIEDGDVVVLEQRILGAAAGGAVRVEADEQRRRGIRARLAIGERVAHGVAVQLPGFGKRLEEAGLEPGVGGQGERLGGVRVDAALPVGVDDLGRQAAEAHALLHRALGDAEPGGDLLGRGAVAGEPAERHHLIGGMHGDAHGVLGQRGLDRGVPVDDEARHGVVLRDRLVGGERLQRPQAPRAGRNPEEGLAARHDDEVLEEPVGLDRGDEFGVGLGPGGVAGGRAHVALVDAQLVQRNEPRPGGSGGGGCLLHGMSPWLQSGMAEPGCRARARWGQGRRVSAAPGRGVP